MAAGHGRRCTTRLQRNDRVRRGSRARPRNGTCNRSMVVPTKPSTAGSRVTASAIMIPTARAEPKATPCR